MDVTRFIETEDEEERRLMLAIASKAMEEREKRERNLAVMIANNVRKVLFK